MTLTTTTIRKWLAGAALVCVVGGAAVGLRQRAAARPVHHRIPVRFWHMWTGEWTPKMNQIVDEFNKSQDKYEVIPLLIPSGDANSKFLLAVAGGDPPDVMAQWEQSITTRAESGILEPLDTMMSPADRAAYNQSYPVVKENGWYKGHLYGLVHSFDIYACYYRPDQFRAAGLDPDRFPKTLEELIAVGKKLDRYNSAGELTRLGFLPEGFTQYAPAFGGSFYDPATGKALVDTPQNRDAMTCLVNARNAIGSDKVLQFDSSLSSGDAGSWPFITGALSITLDGEWRVHQLAQFAPDLDYRVALLPPPAGGKQMSSFANMGYLTIPAGAKHADGAWQFIRFWTGLDNRDRGARYNALFCWLPTSPEMARTPSYKQFIHDNPKFQTFVDLASSSNIVSTPPVPEQLFLMDRIQAADESATRGTLSPDQALAGAQAALAQEMRRRKELGYEE